MDKQDILYCSNKEYITYMLASIVSYLENANYTSVNFHIICNGFDLEDYKKIEKILSTYPNVSVKFYNMDKFNIEKYNVPNWRNNQVANSLLFFESLLGSELLKIQNLLYLDADTIVASPLSELELYNKATIAAAKDPCFKKYYHSLGLTNYYNSGVLYFNIEQWLKNSCQDKIIKFLEQNKQKLTYPDQDILNLALQEEFVRLPGSYNVYPTEFIFNGCLRNIYFNSSLNLSASDVLESVSNPKILHSGGLFGIKPWTKNNINPFNDEFMKYIKQVDPNFEKEILEKNKAFIANSGILIKPILLVRKKLSDKAIERIRKKF